MEEGTSTVVIYISALMIIGALMLILILIDIIFLLVMKYRYTTRLKNSKLLELIDRTLDRIG